MSAGHTAPVSGATADNSTLTVSPTHPATASGGTDVSSPVVHFTSLNDSVFINATVTTLPPGGENTAGMPGGVIALLLGLLALGVAVLCLIIYLKRTGKLYKMIPFKPLTRDRRSSTSSSHRPLELEEGDRGGADHSRLDDLPTPREGSMFTIDDLDAEQADNDSQSRGTNDEYFYDEVFGKSMFEDEVTNASMRQLYMAGEQEEDDMFDVDAIVSSITGTKSTSTKT